MDAYTLLTRRSERVFWMTDDAIAWGDDPQQRMAFADIRTIRRYDQLGLSNGIAAATACDLIGRTGEKLSLISTRAGLDRSSEFARFDAELRRRAAAYPQAGLWSGLPKPVWASYALWFLCAAAMAVFCGLVVVLAAWAWLARDVTAPPAIGVVVCALLGSVSGLNAAIIWRTLQRQWPRQQGVAPPEHGLLKRMVFLPLLVVSAAVFALAGFAGVVSAVQWGTASPAAPSAGVGSTFVITAIVAGLMVRASWRVLRRERMRRKSALRDAERSGRPA